MENKFQQIQSKLSLFQSEFDAKRKRKQEKQAIKEQQANDEDSFEAYAKNVDKKLIASAKKWQDKSAKKSKNPRKNVVDDMEMLDGMLGQDTTYENIVAPLKPLGPYLLFHIQKSSELKYKKLIAISQSKSGHKTIDQELYKQKISDSVAIYEQWNAMDMLEKDQYYLQYENRLHKYNILNEEFRVLTNRKKILKPYNRFYKKMNGMLEVQGKYTIAQITQIIKQKWAVLTEEEKNQYELQYQQQVEQMQQIQKDKAQRIKVYRQKLVQYEKQEELQKMEILNKYNLVPKELDQIAKMAEDQKVLRNYEKKQERQRNKKRHEKLKKQIMQQNQKKLLQLKQKQIMELKMQNYELEGLPRDIFMATPCRVGQKISNSSTTISESKPLTDKDDSVSDSGSDGSQMRKTKQIKKQREQKQRPPGMSTFKKLLMEIRSTQTKN